MASRTSERFTSSQPRFITVASRNPSYQENTESPMSAMGESRDPDDSLRNCLNEAMVKMKESLGEDDPQVGFFLNVIGDACQQNGDFDEALRFYREAIGFKEKFLRLGHPDCADINVSIGTILKEKRMLQESIEIFEKALHVYETAANDKYNAEEEELELQLKIVNTSNHIGNVYFERGELDTAMKTYRRALSAAKKAIPDKGKEKSLEQNISERMYIHVADTLNNIASVHAEKGERKEALRAYNDALALQMSALGEDDLAVANTLNNIGTFNFREGRFQVALKSYRQVLKMRRLILGQMHESVADALFNMGLVCTRLGLLDRANRSFTDALRVAQNTLGQSHTKVADILNQLSVVVAKNGDHDAAMDFLNESMYIYKMNGFTDNSPCVQSVSDNILSIKKKQKDGNSLVDAFDMFSKSITGDICTALSFHPNADVNNGKDEIDRLAVHSR